MNSRIYRGSVMHARLHPVKHAFRYPVFFFAIDLDDLPALDRLGPAFGHNRKALFSFFDADHLDDTARPVRDKVLELLARAGRAADVTKIWIVTCARYLNHVFNPVSFYYCCAGDGSLRCAVAEVNNTFGERHVYVLDHPSLSPGQSTFRFGADKVFHVSPFNNREGSYQFALSPMDQRLDIRVDLHREGREVIKTQWEGRGIPVARGSLFSTALRFPLSAFLTIPRIHWEAAKLYFVKRLDFFSKPAPQSDLTMQTRAPTLVERMGIRLMDGYLSQMNHGRLRVTMPDRSQRTYGPEGESALDLVIRDYRFFDRLLRHGDIGFGESFMAGEWESPDVTALISLMVRNREALGGHDVTHAWLGRMANVLLHRQRSNTVHGSRKNISAHYDLSNDFFRLFLDPTMMYSSGVYLKPTETLEESQLNKMRMIIDKARIRSDHHVLEIGSGWGGFAMEIVRRTGCRVTSITVSKEQLELARQRVKEAGLEDRITFEFRDYRHIEGQFDRIVSIEMLEAVGHANFTTFFQAVDKALKPEGLAVLQVITIPDQRYDEYRKGVDWIQKHIFPGGHLPSLTALTEAMTRSSNLMVEHLENIGPHYARTLREWQDAFLAKRDAVKAMGFDDSFIRKWIYYFSYCEAGFVTRTLNNLHLVLTRPNNPSLDR